MVAGHYRVGRVLRVGGCVEVAPLQEGERSVGDTSVDCLSILGFPNYEGVVLTNAGQEFVVRGELQFQNLILHSAKDGQRLTCLHVPKNDRGVRHSLEHGSLLASRYDVA